MFPEWTWVVGLWIGAAVGSFLNVVIYRLPRGLTVNEPKHSFCPSCKNRLSWAELVPVLSWVVQRGRCRQCGVAVSARYVVVELVTGALWAALWWQYLSGPHTEGDPVRAVAYMLLASCLVAAVFTDLAFYVIPDQLNAAMLAVGFGMNAAMVAQGRPEAWTWGMPSSLAGAWTGVAVLWGIAFLGRILFRKDAMGHGDIKLARGVGSVLFPMLAVASFGIAVAVGAVVGIGIALGRKSASPGPAEQAHDEEDDGPEPVGSLLKCGLGYALGIDVVGLVLEGINRARGDKRLPEVYQKWFGEDPYDYSGVEEEPEVELTTIPFGPYLAAGAVAAMLFSEPISRAVSDYLAQFSAQ
jgi:leader peptidase (prepilin peptidase)/N-methyltransferase